MEGTGSEGDSDNLEIVARGVDDDLSGAVGRACAFIVEHFTKQKKLRNYLAS